MENIDFHRVEKVIKRSHNGEERVENFDLYKIIKRLNTLAMDPYPLSNVNTMEIIDTMSRNIVDRITTTELDMFAADVCAIKSTTEPEYDKMASRIAVSNIYKNTEPTFSRMINLVRNNVDTEILAIIDANTECINNMIVSERDMLFSYYGLKCLQETYLLRNAHKEIIERPQYMWLRVALQIHKTDFTRVKETYDLLSSHKFIHASPTLFNSCMVNNQLSSCMLLTNREDSIPGIYETNKECAILGALTAGIGVSMTNIRAKHSLIKTTNRPSKGLVPFVTTHNMMSGVIDQGGKRKMSEAIYIEPWHADFMEILSLKSTDNKSGIMLDKIFLACWSNNLLNERVKNNQHWSLFCPTKAPKLINAYGKEFEEAYIQYEQAGVANSIISARSVYTLIIKIMIEKGMPYMLNKDACNFKSNLKNVSHINCSNLCAEILIPSGFIDGEYEIGVCTLASINLISMVTPCKWSKNGEIIEPGSFNFEELANVTRVACRNLNNIIDYQMYPLSACERSSRKHRPIGIGIQALADVFMALGYPFTSAEAKYLNWRIAEEMYYAAITESMELAKEYGPYITFDGSPASQGILQPHLWQQYGSTPLPYVKDWDAIAELVKTHGLRNSLMLAFMPTAGTSNILGGNPSFEPCVSHIISKRNLVGTFTVVNKWLIDLFKVMGIWNNEMKENIIANDGSIDHLDIPEHIRNVFKTAWEISPVETMSMSADRGQFICQSQSNNIYIKDVTHAKLSALINYGFDLGLKTISYYIRSRAATEAVKFTIAGSVEESAKKHKAKKAKRAVCNDEEGCLMCSS